MDFHKLIRRQQTTLSSHKTPEADQAPTLDYESYFRTPPSNLAIADLGDLQVTSDRLALCDPLVHEQVQVLEDKIEPGTFPVMALLAPTRVGKRIALVKVQFRSITPEHWHMARCARTSTGQEASLLDGFLVDSGMGCLADDQSMTEYLAFVALFRQHHPDKNLYDDFLAERFKVNAEDPDNPRDLGEWCNFILPETQHNMVLFTTGLGGGFYSSYWGLAADGAICCLVIDFGLLAPNHEEGTV